jgi:hypothetical protein
LRFFGGLHDANIAEILGVDTPAVCQDEVRTGARFDKGLSI